MVTPQRRLASLGFGAIFVLLVGGAFYAWRTRPKPLASLSESLAPLRACGPELTADVFGKPDALVATEFEDLGAEAQKALRRAAAAIPPAVREALIAAHYQLSVVTKPGLCRDVYGKGSGEIAACLVDREPQEGEVAKGPATVRHLVTLVIPRAELEDTQELTRSIHQMLLPAAMGAYLRFVLGSHLGSEPTPAKTLSPAAQFHAVELQLAQALAGPERGDDLLRQRYGAAWTAAPEAVERGLLYVTDWFYCSAGTRAKLKENQGAAEAFFAKTLQCGLGRPWYATDAELATTCGASH